MSDLLDEIKEDLKEEKIAELWKKYGNYLIIGAVGAVFATGATAWWKDRQVAQFEALGNKLVQAITTPENGDSSIEIYNSIITSGNPEYAAIASLRKASLLKNQGKIAEAGDIYKEVMDKKAAPEEMRDLAELLYLYNEINEKSGALSEDIMNRINALSQTGKPYRFSALELLAFKEHENGNKAKAKELFQKLLDDKSTPGAIQQRSREMLEVIG